MQRGEHRGARDCSQPHGHALDESAKEEAAVEKLF